MQWSRPFIGLKVFLSLAVAEGYAGTIRHQTSMGTLLRERLRSDGWTIANNTPLPIVCFFDPDGDDERQKSIAMFVVASGIAWISTTLLAGTRTVLRACVTNYLTQANDIDASRGVAVGERTITAGVAEQVGATAGVALHRSRQGSGGRFWLRPYRD
jgi:aromatic-L-amino-acid/L-tryptophan decarboxylase